MKVDAAIPQVQLSRLRRARATGLLLRFVFGFVISVLAALFGIRFGNRLGGLFLAFPAILPASLTLIEKKHGDNPAGINATGAVLGALALLAFAFVAAVLLKPQPPLVALLLATAAWLAVAVGLYFAVTALRIAAGQTPRPVERERS
jgi:hypothetical protein